MMKSLLNKVIKPFLPRYEVVCTTYQVIPGLPVSKNESRHPFEKGASKEAREFFGKVISSEFTRNMAPVEVHLKRGRFTVEKRQFGPVQELKQFKIVA